jgi:hypothetical protein
MGYFPNSELEFEIRNERMFAMSKKHFIALADVLRRLKPEDPNTVSPTDSVGYDIARFQTAQWERTVRDLADFCQSQNAQFKRDRWLGYIRGECGPNGGVR